MAFSRNRGSSSCAFLALLPHYHFFSDAILWCTERPRVVQHEWDPNNPDDPVFLVQPDGGVGLAYQIPGTPSAKSVSLGPFAERQRRTPRERLAALRACTCMAAPVADDNEAQSPEGTGSNEDGSDSLTITTRPSPGTTRQSSRAGSRSGHGRSAPGRSKTGVLLLLRLVAALL